MKRLFKSLAGSIFAAVAGLIGSAASFSATTAAAKPQSTKPAAVTAPNSSAKQKPVQAVHATPPRPTRHTPPHLSARAPNVGVRYMAHRAVAFTPARPLVFPEPTLEVSNSDSAANIKASEILGRMDKAYHSLASFSATFDARSSDDPGTPICHADIAFQRAPERAIATITSPNNAVYVYDGTHIIMFPSPDPAHFTFTDNVWDNLAGSGIAAVFGRLIDDPKQDLLSRMVTAGFQTQNDLGMIVQLNLLPRVTVDDHLCDSLQAILEDGSRVLLVIGVTDHMLRRATWSHLNSSGHDIYYVEQYNDIRTNPALQSSFFVFKPPPGVSLEVGF